MFLFIYMVTCYSYWGTLFLKCLGGVRVGSVVAVRVVVVVGAGVWGLEGVVSPGILAGIMGTTGPETQQSLLFVWSDLDLAKHLFDSIQWILIEGRLLHVEAQHKTKHHFAEPQYSLTVSIVKHFYFVGFHFHCYSSREDVLYTPTLNIKPSEIIIISIAGIVYFTLYSIVLSTFRISPIGNLQWQ